MFSSPDKDHNSKIVSSGKSFEELIETDGEVKKKTVTHVSVKQAKKIDNQTKKLTKLERKKSNPTLYEDHKESLIEWEKFVSEQKHTLKYTGWKGVSSEGDSIPFPLSNFVSFVDTIVDEEYGFETKYLYLHGGVSKKGKSDKLFIIEMKKISGTTEFKEVICKNSPSGRSHHSCSGVMKKVTSKEQSSIYIFGGELSGLFTNYSNEFFELDLNEKLWKKIEYKVGPGPRSRHSSCISGENVYLFGGTNGKKFFADLWCYDVKNDSFNLIETDLKPTPRVSHSMVSSTLEQKFYIIGGSRGDFGDLKEIWEYDSEHGKWKERNFHLPNNQPITNPHSIPAKDSSTVMIGPKIIIFGGETLMKDLKIETALADFLIYDTETEELIRSGDSNESYGLKGHNLIWWNDKFVLLGGTNSKKFKHHTSLITIDEAMCGKFILTGKTFNVSLEDSMKRPENQNLKIPLIIQQTVDYLLEEGFDSEGIFRKSGRHSDVIFLNAIFENGLVFNKNRFKDPNAVAVVLKRYLTSLPEPILTFDLYEQFMNVFEKENFEQELINTVEKLSTLRYNISKKIFSILYKVQLNQKTTLMGSKNLIIILGPYLLACRESSSNVKDKEKSPLPYLIENYPKIWEYKNEEEKEMIDIKEELKVKPKEEELKEESKEDIKEEPKIEIKEEVIEETKKNEQVEEIKKHQESEELKQEEIEEINNEIEETHEEIKEEIKEDIPSEVEEIKEDIPSEADEIKSEPKIQKSTEEEINSVKQDDSISDIKTEEPTVKEEKEEEIVEETMKEE